MNLLGLSEKMAIDMLDAVAAAWRIASRDGEAFLLTADFKPLRYNLTIEKGKVAYVVMG